MTFSEAGQKPITRGFKILLLLLLLLRHFSRV